MQPTQTSGSQIFATQPSWSQDYTNMNSGVPDSKYWNALVGPAENSNHEQQYYTSNVENLRVENGALRLIATNSAQPRGYEYGSARLETQGKISFLYGRFDISAKLPSGHGTWPAVWLLPANNTYSSLSPASDLKRYKNGGEIDIIEGVGSQPNVNYGVAHTVSDLILRANGTGSHGTVKVVNSTTEFHTYSLLWTPTSLAFAVDDVVFYTYSRQIGADYKTWPFDQPFYMIANLAIGGSWGGADKSRFADGIDSSALPASLDIRSINYYPYVGSTTVE
jgi:beta-glucanase (GH16 family)